MKQKFVLLKKNTNLYEIISKAGVFFILKILGLALGYLFTYFVTKKFGNETYGLIILGFTFFMILSVIGKFGFDLNITKFISSKNYKRADLLSLFYKVNFFSFVFSLIISILIIIFNNKICNFFFNKPQFEPYLFWTAVSFPFWSVILIHSGFYRGLKNNFLFSIFNSFGRFLVTVIILIIAYYFFGFRNNELPIIVHFIALVLLATSSFFVTNKIWKFENINSKINTKSFIKESIPILISSFVFILLTWIDRVFIGIYKSESEIAIYDVAAKLALLVSFNLDAINSILAPKISEFFHKNDLIKLGKTVNFTVKISSIISILTFLMLIFLGDFFLNIFGDEYLGGKLVLLILAFGQLINCFSGSVGLLLQMTGFQNIYKKIMLYGLIINIFLNLVLIKNYGIEGVAFSTMISIISWNFLGIYFVKKKLKIDSFYNPFRN